MREFAKIVRAELIHARERHGTQHSAHESFAVILEKLEEFWEQARIKRELRNKIIMLRKLVQIAAMAQRAAEDLGLIEPEKF